MLTPLCAAVEPLEPRALFSAGLPRPDHVVVVVYENRSYSSVIGNAKAPYINSLTRQGASFTQYKALTAPSQPNYIALFSGSQQGVINNNVPYTFDAPSLGGQLIGKGLSFGGYSEDLPYVGFTGTGKLAYHRRHNPWVDFTDVPASANMPWTQFPAPGHYDSLPTVSFVVPNLLHDMHDGDMKTGDTWLKDNLDPYVQWAKTHNSLFVFTFDETDHKGDKNIPTIVIGQAVKPGNYSATLNHYNLLRTIEDMYGLSHLGNAASAAPITGIWKGSTPTPTPTPTPAPTPGATSLVASADGFVWDGVPDAHFGRARVLDVKSNSPGLNRDAYFRFDTSSLSGDVSSAKLRFYGGLTASGTMSAGVFAVHDTGWSESGLSWSTRPKVGEQLGGVTISSTSNGWYEVDVSDYVRAERNAGHTAVSLVVHSLKVTTAKLGIASRESANAPRLVLA
jgi:hypothetical protein